MSEGALIEAHQAGPMIPMSGPSSAVTDVNPRGATVARAAATQPPAHPDRGGYRATATNAIRLALGYPLREIEFVDWDAVFAFAVNERIAALVWHRSSSYIRSVAPPDVSSRWRSFAIAARFHAERQLLVLLEVIGTLERANSGPVVLKGLPLSTRLYGDYAIRSVGDHDVFVDLAARTPARRALMDTGWTVIDGAPPLTETFMATRDSREVFLEIHSSLVDENLTHLHPRSPLAVRVQVGDTRLPVLDDPLLAAYLAAHASKHMPAALLYFFDFRALWLRYDAEQRSAAMTEAKRAGLAGYLRWMQRQTAALEAASSGDPVGLATLGIRERGRRDVHAIFRDVVLASSLRGAILAAAAWIWPIHLRSDRRAFLRRCAHRLRAPWLKYVFPRPSSEKGTR